MGTSYMPRRLKAQDGDLFDSEHVDRFFGRVFGKKRTDFLRRHCFVFGNQIFVKWRDFWTEFTPSQREFCLLNGFLVEGHTG